LGGSDLQLALQQLHFPPHWLSRCVSQQTGKRDRESLRRGFVIAPNRDHLRASDEFPIAVIGGGVPARIGRVGKIP
jgi:hypothetical protein